MSKRLLIIILFALIIFIFSLILWHFYWNNFTPEIFSSLGQYYSGSIGIIITLFFAIIALTTYLHQVKINNKLMFENSFFKLLTIYERLADGMDLSKYVSGVPDTSNFKGKNSFDHLYKSLEGVYLSGFYAIKYRIGNDITDKFSEDKKRRILNSLKEAIDVFNFEFKNEISNYFSLINNIIKFVDQQEFLNIEEKKFYIDMFKSELSHNEILLIYYYALFSEKLKNLIKQYNFLENIILEELIDKNNSDHRRLYD